MDNKWMSQALFLAYLYKGRTSPNPTVAAVLIGHDGKYIGSGITQKAGQNHAERDLLENTPLKLSQGATLYVTLEPCCFTGKTPACTDIIIEKKIARVVIAVQDPNTKVAGLGVKILQEAGINVDIGIMEKEATKINQDFFYAIQHKKPYTFAKFALSLDGCLATHTGDSQWISNPKARRYTHILRYRADAICVGTNTVIKDDPTLTCRLDNHRYDNKILYRVILDPNARIPLSKKVLQDDLPTLWVIDKNCKNYLSIKEVSHRYNKEIFYLDYPLGLDPLLEYLYKQKQILSLMIEGGSRVLGAFMQENLIQSMFISYGNMFLGNGLKPFPLNISTVHSAPQLYNIHIKIMKDQYYLYGDVK